jgi:hypothetical protein
MKCVLFNTINFILKRPVKLGFFGQSNLFEGERVGRVMTGIPLI